MQTRGLYVATAVLIILGGLWYWSQHRKPSDDTTKSYAETPPAILKLDQNSITRVALTKKDSPPVILAKTIMERNRSRSSNRAFAADRNGTTQSDRNLVARIPQQA